MSTIPNVSLQPLDLPDLAADCCNIAHVVAEFDPVHDDRAFLVFLQAVDGPNPG